MRPRKYTKAEWWHMKLDLLRELALREVTRPKEVMEVEAFRPWFADSDREDVDELVAELVSDEACPLEYVTKAERAVWLTDVSAVPEYVRENGGMDL